MRILSFALRTSLALLPFALTLVCALWFLAQSPFTSPVVSRSSAQIDAALTRAMAQRVTLAWLLPRTQDALLQQDLIELEVLLDLANIHGVILPRPMIKDIATLDAARSGVVARTTACGACAIDINACETLAQIGVCAVPFELTPAGDVNALRRAGLAYLGGEDVDRLDLGLAAIGLGATGAVLVSGGTSYTVKAGASALRIAGRMGSLTPAFTPRLRGMVDDAIHWNKIGDLARGRIAPSALVDSTKLDELRNLAGHLQQVTTHTSLAETLVLLRYVDSAQDAAKLADVSAAMGPRTRGAFAVLGKSRVFRATVRLSNLAIGAAAAIYLLGLQVLLFTTQRCGIFCLHLVLRRFA